MKKSLPKTIFFTLFYLALAYLSLLLSFVTLDYYNDFQIENNFDRVNHICLAVVGMFCNLFAIMFLVIAFIFPIQYIKSLKERGDY